MSVPSKAAVRRYVGTAVLLSAGYVGLVFLAVYVLNTWESSPWRWILSITPAVPIVLGWPAFTRILREYDELQRKIAGEALQIAFGITAMATFAYGWLEFAGLPPVNLTLVFPFMMLVFGIAYAVGYGRYSR